MKTNKRILPVMIAFIIAIILATGCSSISVNQDYDPTFDFAKLKTFGFLPVPSSAGIDQLTANRLSDAIKAQLIAKGYTLSEKADFGIALHLGKQTVTNVQSYGYGYGYWGGMGAGGLNVSQYQQGTLIIDIIDMADNKLVWRGTGQGALADNPNVQERTQNTNNAVTQILAQFPPDKTSK